jgi:hypothetical protein
LLLTSDGGQKQRRRKQAKENAGRQVQSGGNRRAKYRRHPADRHVLDQSPA